MNYIEVKNLLKGSKIIDADCSIIGDSMQRMTVETFDGRLLLIEPSVDKYEGIVVGYSFRITDVKTLERLA
jgi:hypothetical protein